MLQISAFTNGTFVSSLDVQAAVFESETRGSALWLDVYRPRDNEVILFRKVGDVTPPADDSFVFSLAGFSTLKRITVSREDSRKKGPVLMADATVLYADDLVVTIRTRGFSFNELVDYMMRRNGNKMPTDPAGLYNLLPVTYFSMFARDLSNPGRTEFVSERTPRYEEDLVYFHDLSWTLREVTLPMSSLLRHEDSDSLMMSLTASRSVADRISSARITLLSSTAVGRRKPTPPPAPASAPAAYRPEDFIRSTAREIPSAVRRQAAPKKKPVLVVKKGPDVGKVYVLDGPVYRLGRDTSNDILILANGVSRRHAVINVSDDKVVITDLGSTNGTYVNARKVEQTVLSPGDEIFLGTAVLRFELR